MDFVTETLLPYLTLLWLIGFLLLLLWIIARVFRKKKEDYGIKININK